MHTTYLQLFTQHLLLINKASRQTCPTHQVSHIDVFVNTVTQLAFDSLVVRGADCQPDDPGSTPGGGLKMFHDSSDFVSNVIGECSLTGPDFISMHEIFSCIVAIMMFQTFAFRHSKLHLFEFSCNITNQLHLTPAASPP